MKMVEQPLTHEHMNHDGQEGQHQQFHEHPDHAAHGQAVDHRGYSEHSGHGAHADHNGHEQMFRRRFWVCLVLTIPVLLFSPAIQEWLGFHMPEFPGSQWIGAVFAIAIFLYGGFPSYKWPRQKSRAASRG